MPEQKALFSSQIVNDPGEAPLFIHSRVTGDIAEMSLLRRSLLFTELSMIAHNDSNEAQRAINAIKFILRTLNNHAVERLNCWHGFLSELGWFRLNPFSDNRIHEYIESLADIVEKKERKR